MEHLAHIEEDNGRAGEEFSREYGVNCRSKLLDLEHFDLCGGGLLPDIMHDMMEGVLPHVLSLLLHYCIEEKRFFSMAYLNEKILNFEYGYMENSHPSPIDHSKHLKQNGTKHDSYNISV